jgi:subtilisin family serine protease
MKVANRLGIAVLLVLLSASAFAEKVIIRAAKPYNALRAKIVALGGTVSYEFKNANAIAADLPDATKLAGMSEVQAYSRDLVVPNPAPSEVAAVASELPAGSETGDVPTNYYPYNSDLTNSGPLLNSGYFGSGIVVGVIDSGTSRTASALCANASTAANCSATSRVIGGENFVPGLGEPNANASTNNPHGTWVACMIGANRTFLFLKTGRLATAVRNYCTPAASSPCSSTFSPTIDAIPMVGQAPAAQFYALKVFPASGGGAPESRVLQAMDRAIELKQTTLPNMRVVNMSLGGPTLYVAKDVEDMLASSMAAAGISLVVSAGNEGPSGTTVGSPGTAKDILTIGAANSAVHERILRDVQFGTGIGALYRPDSTQQIAYFSSRGPNADGRVDPEVVANGFGSYAQGANGGISLVSGTSFSGPTVAGVTALLYSANPAATPSAIRAAIVNSARPAIIPTATNVDQGKGYVDAAGALAILNSPGAAPDNGKGNKHVRDNVKQIVDVINKDVFTMHVANLRPAERREVYYEVKEKTGAVKVSLTNITPNGPGSNVLFGEDILFTVHTAKTSSFNDYLAFDFVAADTDYEFTLPETGLMRITVNGDWTNAGQISADLRIESVKAKLPKKDFHGKIAEGEENTHSFTVAPGTAEMTVSLSWKGDWGSYPTNDIDLILEAPGGALNFDGATLNSPERVTITSPAPGTWTATVIGFSLPEKEDHYELRID